jgi:alkylhydroperoxidase family enzyme
LHARCLNVHGVAPTNASALWNVDVCLSQCGLGVRLIALAKIRISRVNQCVCGLDMRGAAPGSTEPDIRITEPQPPGSHQGEVHRPFDDTKLVDLTTLIAMINLSNRLPISLRCELQMGVPA